MRGEREERDTDCEGRERGERHTVRRGAHTARGEREGRGCGGG